MQNDNEARLQKQLGLALEALEVLADGDGEPTDIARQTLDDITRVGMEAVALQEMDVNARSRPDTSAGVEEIARFVEQWNGSTRDGDTFLIADAIREAFSLPPTAEASARKAALEEAAAVLSENWGLPIQRFVLDGFKKITDGEGHETFFATEEVERVLAERLSAIRALAEKDG